MTRRQPGDGRRLLWLHGYTLDSSVFAPPWTALPQFDHVAIDLPGHGSAPPPTDGDIFAASVEAVRQALDTWAVRDVVAMSYGGGVVLRLLADEPERLDSVVLAAPALPGGPIDQESLDCHLELIRMARERGLGPWLAERWTSRPPQIFAGLAEQREPFARICGIIGRHSFCELLDDVPTLASEPVRDRQLKAIGCRTMMLVGDRDMTSFKLTATLLKRTIPGAELRWVAAAGHLPLLEAPRACARELISWLEP